MSKTPLLFRKNNKDFEGLLGYRDQDGYLESGKYTASPRNAIDKNFSADKITRIVNYKQDNCIVVTERSAGTNAILITGDAGRELMQKCFEKKWRFFFIVPGVAHRLCNINAEPGEPVEMKFYFYESYKFKKEDDDKEKEKSLSYYYNCIMLALRHFYAFDDLEIEGNLMYSILEGKNVFFGFKNEDLRHSIRGHFFEVSSPPLKK